MTKIGLVTITYNGANVIDGFIDSVNKQDYENLVLYIVDNDSNDTTIEQVESSANLSKTVIIKNKFNNGVAGGNNQGIQKALEDGCEYIVLINNDTEFESSLITKLLQSSIEQQFSVVVPKMMYYNEPDVIWFAGGFLKRSNGYMNYHEGTGEKDLGQFKDKQITYAPTCCALIHRIVFEDIGLMDEKYFVYFDDTDFWYRMLKHGKHKMWYINDVSFYHKVGSLTKSKSGTREKFKFGNFVIRYSIRNRIYYLRKQKSIKSLLYITWFWFRVNLRFILSGKYHINLQTWKLIQHSYCEGLSL